MCPDLNTARLNMTSKYVDNNCRNPTYLHFVTQFSPGSIDYSPSINKNLPIPHPFVVSRESVLARLCSWDPVRIWTLLRG